MSRPLIVADDSALGDSVTSRLIERGLVVRTIPNVNFEGTLENVEIIVVHASPLKGRRSLTQGIEVAKQLRRDCRYKGRIIFYSIQSLDTLQEKQKFFDYVKEGMANRWGVSFFTLPGQIAELLDACVKTQTFNLSEDDLLEFNLRFCDLKAYFEVGWSDVAHLAQSGQLLGGCRELVLKRLLQNTKDYGSTYITRRDALQVNTKDGVVAPYMPSKVVDAINLLESIQENVPDHQREELTRAIGIIQEWLGIVMALPPVNNGSVPYSFSFVLVADDDPFETSSLEKFGYRADLVSDPQTARELLYEREHAVFLCDLTWWGDVNVGLELIDEAVRCEVPIIIAMSAGGGRRSLPEGVLLCEGIERKHNSAYIHHLILDRARELEENSDERKPTTY
jgi:hypothetical protein